MSDRVELLVVDDAPESLDFLVRFLTGNGFGVRHADEGELALISVETALPDLILLDVHMPGLDGFEVLRRLKAGQRTKDIPVILLSASGDYAERILGFEMGAVDFVTKPFQECELLARVRTHLELARLRFEAEERAAERLTNLAVTNQQLNAEISERNLAEESLRESENRLRNLINSMPDIVCFKDGNGRWLEANAFDLELFQLVDVDYRGKTDAQLAEFSPFYRDAFLTCGETDERAWAAGNVTRAEESIPRPSGPPLVFDVIKVPIFAEDGTRVGLIVVGRDITDLKEAEVSLRQLNERLELATGSAGLGVWDWNLQTGVMSWDDRMLELYGVDRREFQGTVEDWKRGLHPEDLEGAVAACEAALEGRAAFNTQFRLRHSDGTVIWVKGVGLVERDETGSPTRMVGINQDLTEMRKAEKEREKLRQQLAQSQKMESLGNLAGGIAHDLNNVLAAILGMASTVQGRFQAPDPTARIMETITRACLRGRDVVKSLLVFARRELGEEKPLNLNDLVKETVELLSHTTLKRVDLLLNLEEPLPELLGDSAALSHCLINLCVNAVDATPGRGTITFCTHREPGKGVTLSVRDTGTGMSPEVMERAIEPFFTTKPKGKGTGLGLAMVYGTMQAHDGSLTLHSRPEEGTEVILSFPESRLVVTSNMGTPIEPEAEASKVLRVLVVDDDDLVQATTTIMLQALGLETTAVSSGEEALQALQDGLAVDLVILDMQMVGISGSETLAQIRVLCPQQRVLLASGYVDESIETLVNSDPDTGFIPKPFGLEELKQALRKQ